MIKKGKITFISEEPEEVGGQVKKLKKKLKECQKEKEDYLTQAQRARADLINFRRRQEQVLENFKNYSQADFIRELLPVLDSLEMGAENNKGIKQIKEQIENIFKKNGLEQIKTLNEKFNPEIHEAVEQVSGGKSGTIIEEIQKGYLLGDKLLRVSKVKVAK